MKIKLLFIGFLILANTQSNAQVKRYVNAEIKAHCKCLKSYEKKSKKAEKKYEKKDHDESSSDDTNERLFGGHSVDFNLDECLNQKRNNKLKGYIEVIDGREKRRFIRKVKRKIKKKCPNINSKHYEW